MIHPKRSRDDFVSNQLNSRPLSLPDEQGIRLQKKIEEFSKKGRTEKPQMNPKEIFDPECSLTLSLWPVQTNKFKISNIFCHNFTAQFSRASLLIFGSQECFQLFPKVSYTYRPRWLISSKVWRNNLCLQGVCSNAFFLYRVINRSSIVSDNLRQLFNRSSLKN